jgi:hypothetical protein
MIRFTLSTLTLLFTPLWLCAVVSQTFISPLVEESALDNEAWKMAPKYELGEMQQVFKRNGWSGVDDFSGTVQTCWTDKHFVVRIEIVDDEYKPGDKSLHNGLDGDHVRISLSHYSCGPDRKISNPWSVIMLPDPDDSACDLVLDPPRSSEPDKFGVPEVAIHQTMEGFTLLLTVPYEQWDDPPRNGATMRFQAIFGDSDEAGKLNHRFTLIPQTRDAQKVETRTREFGRLRFVENYWAIARPRDVVFQDHTAMYLVDIGNFSGEDAVAKLMIEPAKAGARRTLGMPETRLPLTAESTQQAIEVPIDFRGLESGLYRLKLAAGGRYLRSDYTQYYDSKSGLVFSMELIERRKKRKARDLAIYDRDHSVREAFRHMAGGGQVLWHAGKYDATSSEFGARIRRPGSYEVVIPDAEAGDLPWALFGGLNNLDGMAEPLVLQLSGLALGTALQPEMPLYNHDLMKKQIKVNAHRLLLVGVSVPYIDEDSFAELHIYNRQGTMLKQVLRCSEGQKGKSQSFVFRVWLQTVDNELRIENSSEGGGAMEIDFLALLGGGAPTSLPIDKPQLNFGGSKEAELFNKELMTSLYFMRTHMIDKKGRVYGSLPGGRHSGSTVLDQGLLMSELAAWGYITEAKLLSRQAPRHLGVNMTSGHGMDVGRSSLISGIHKTWRMSGQDPEYLDTLWHSTIPHPLNAVSREIDLHPLDLIDSDTEFGVDSRTRRGSTVPACMAARAALTSGIDLARTTQRAEAATGWERSMSRLHSGFQTYLVTSGNGEVLQSSDVFPAGHGWPKVDGIVSSLQPHNWVYGRYNDREPVLYNGDIRVFDTPYLFSCLMFMIESDGYILPDPYDKQLQATYDSMLNSPLFLSDQWHQHNIINYKSNALQLWTVMAALLTDSTPIASRVLDSYIRFTFDEFAPLADFGPSERTDIEISPYTFEEKLNVSSKDGTTQGASHDDLNILSGVTALRTARLVAGIDDHDDMNLQLIPRLPDNWQFIEAKNWIVAHDVGERKNTEVYFNYAREGVHQYKMTLRAEDPLQQVTVRVGPFAAKTRKVSISNAGQRTDMNTERHGLFMWATTEFRNVKILDLNIRPIK